MEKESKIIATIQEVFLNSAGYLNQPTKRIFYAYLLSSLALAIFVYYRKKPKTSLFKYIFHKKTWWSSSAKVDYAFLVFNSIIKVLFIAPFLIFSLKISFYLNQYLIDSFGYYEATHSKALLISLYTLAVFFIGDFASFFLHYLQHRIEFLWRFHKVHHAATVLNPVTQYRIHPVELILNNIKTILIIGALMGLFEYFANGRISVYTFMGVNVINFGFLFFGSNLRHSSVQLKYPTWLEFIFISPFQHQIHHSNASEHFNKNLGSKLAVWDWLFGTLIPSKEVKKIRYGLGKEEDRKFASFFGNLFEPFVFWR